jgi:hypothetical protein
LCHHYQWLVSAALYRFPGSSRARSAIVSIDSAKLSEHEGNRGLEGLEHRLVDGIAQARASGLSVQASVTVNRLVDYDQLPDTLRRLRFDCVSFSYPRSEPFGSTSLVYGESPLVNLDQDELLDALEAIGRLKMQFPVMNPRLAGRGRALCPRRTSCSSLHWRLQVFLFGLESRHLALRGVTEPLGSVFDLDSIPNRREPSNARMMACYRNTSMLMHAAVAATDAALAISAGQIGAAVSSLFRRSVAQSLWALIEETPQMCRLARRRRRTAVNAEGSPDRWRESQRAGAC